MDALEMFEELYVKLRHMQIAVEMGEKSFDKLIAPIHPLVDMTVNSLIVPMTTAAKAKQSSVNLHPMVEIYNIPVCLRIAFHMDIEKQFLFAINVAKNRTETWIRFLIKHKLSGKSIEQSDLLLFPEGAPVSEANQVPIPAPEKPKEVSIPVPVTLSPEEHKKRRKQQESPPTVAERIVTPQDEQELSALRKAKLTIPASPWFKKRYGTVTSHKNLQTMIADDTCRLSLIARAPGKATCGVCMRPTIDCESYVKTGSGTTWDICTACHPVAQAACTFNTALLRNSVKKCDEACTAFQEALENRFK